MVIISKKSQTNQIFVYLLSIILIVFAGFLVIKFVGFFQNDVDTSLNSKLYSKISSDYSKIYSTFGSEKVLKYRVSNDVSYICFIPKNCKIDNLIDPFKSFQEDLISNIKLITNTSKNIILISNEDTIINSGKIGKYYLNSNNCQCIKTKNQIIEIVMENRRGKVYISSE